MAPTISHSASLWRLVQLLVLALLMLVPDVASAQQRFDLQLFRPTPAQSRGGLTVHGAELLDPRQFDVHVMGSMGYAPFTLIDSDDRVEGKLVEGIGSADVLFAAGATDWLQIGFVVPLRFMLAGDVIQGFPTQPLREDTVTLGDVRIVPAFQLYSSRSGATDRGIALALIADVSLPTGDRQAYAGDGGFRADPRLAFDWTFGGGHKLALNAGYTLRPDTEIGTVEVGDALGGGLGMDFRISRVWHLIGDINSAMTLASDLGVEEMPVEGNFGLRAFAGNWMFQAAGGTGFSGGVSAPDWRVVGSIGGTPEIDPDRDDDGIRNRDDACPRDAEDPDGFEDEDGCPDLDNDDDGILDANDACPNEAENMNGIEDLDGCPEPEIGDRDGDGLRDDLDTCPDDPEDIDGFEDSDGCPDPDNDQDGFLDEDDACPMEAGTNLGCPVVYDVPRVRIYVYFDTNSSRLDSLARADLDDVATEIRAVLDEDPNAIVYIEGHADDQGAEAFNVQLSDERAAEVTAYLEALGIESERIETEGYGSTRPLEANDTEVGRRVNRRVEIRIP